jgi:hypothetical protein
VEFETRFIVLYNILTVWILLIWTDVCFLFDILCWMVCLFFWSNCLLRFFFPWFMFGFGVCLLLSRFQIVNNLFWNWYFVRFKTYYCVSPNMALVKISKVRWQFCNQFIFPYFCFHPFIFNIWNCDLHARYFFDIKCIGFLKKIKNISFKNTISILICIQSSLSKI